MNEFTNNGYESEGDVRGVDEPISGTLRHSGGCLPVHVLCCALPLVLILAFPLCLWSIQIFPLLHVTCVICLLQFEVWIVKLSGIPQLLLGHLIFLCKVRGSVRARQCVDMGRKSSVMGDSLFSLNMICLAVISLHILTLLYNI